MPPAARMRRTVVRMRDSVSGDMLEVDVPDRMDSRETCSGANQRAKGPKSAKKGRTPGPGWEGKGPGGGFSVSVEGNGSEGVRH